MQKGANFNLTYLKFSSKQVIPRSSPLSSLPPLTNRLHSSHRLIDLTTFIAQGKQFMKTFTSRRGFARQMVAIVCLLLAIAVSSSLGFAGQAEAQVLSADNIWSDVALNQSTTNQSARPIVPQPAPISPSHSGSPLDGQPISDSVFPQGQWP